MREYARKASAIEEQTGERTVSIRRKGPTLEPSPSADIDAEVPHPFYEPIGILENCLPEACHERIAFAEGDPVNTPSDQKLKANIRPTREGFYKQLRADYVHLQGFCDIGPETALSSRVPKR